MHHVVAFIQQAKLVQLGIAVGIKTCGCAPDMGTDDEIHFLRKAEVVFGHFPCREVYAKGRHRKGDEAVIVRQCTFTQSFQFAAGVRDMCKGQGAFLSVWLGRAMAEQSADAGFLQTANCAVRVAGSGVVVAPVENRRCTDIDLVQCADKIGEVGIVRGVAGSDPGMHFM